MIAEKSRKKVLAVVMAVVAVLAVGLGVYEGKKNISGSDGDQTPGGSAAAANQTASPVGTVLKTDAGDKVTLGPYTRIQIYSPLAEIETKDHFNVPAGMTKVEVSISWQGTGWDLELLMGSGECADMGETLGTASGTSGSLNASYEIANGTLVEGQWFIIVRCPTISSHVRESLVITEKAVVFNSTASTTA